MRLLLDTHALLWWLTDQELALETRTQIADPANSVAVSAVSAWEIAIKQALGKLEAPEDLEQQVHASDFMPLPVVIRHAMRAGRLPRHHEDPFDRMLIAQAQEEQMTIVTRDRRFRNYDVDVVSA